MRVLTRLFQGEGDILLHQQLARVFVQPELNLPLLAVREEEEHGHGRGGGRREAVQLAGTCTLYMVGLEGGVRVYSSTTTELWSK